MGWGVGGERRCGGEWVAMPCWLTKDLYTLRRRIITVLVIDEVEGVWLCGCVCKTGDGPHFRSRV